MCLLIVTIIFLLFKEQFIKYLMLFMPSFWASWIFSVATVPEVQRRTAFCKNNHDLSCSRRTCQLNPRQSFSPLSWLGDEEPSVTAVTAFILNR